MTIPTVDSLLIDNESPSWQDGESERGLWCAALELLLLDARAFWRGNRPRGAGTVGLAAEAAFDDVLRCGPMLRRLCSFAGYEPDWIAARFVASLE